MSAPSSADAAGMIAELRNVPRHVLLGGWYGAANLGDELILRVLLEWVGEAGGTATVISNRPAYTQETQGVAAVPYADLAAIAEAAAKADLFALGGGGLFQDYNVLDAPSLFRFPAMNVAQFAQFLYIGREFGLPTMALAQGVGPLRSLEAQAVARDVFAWATHASVRDFASARLLRDAGLDRDVMVAPDPGWCWQPPKPGAPLAQRFPMLRGKKVMALVPREWAYAEGWAAEFAEAVRAALPGDWACLWLDFHCDTGSPRGGPSAIVNELIERIGARYVHAIWDGNALDDAAATLAAADACIVMRLHALMLALKQGVPVIALEYDDKMRVLGDSVNLPAVGRVPLADIRQRLPAALRVVAGADPGQWLGPPGDAIAAQATGALGHRDLLWHAMAQAPAPPAYGRGSLPDFNWLAAWQKAGVADAHRVTSALEVRVRDECFQVRSLRAANAAADAELSTLRSQVESQHTELSETQQRVAGLASELAASRSEALDAIDARERVVNSRSYRLTRPLRVVAGAGRRIRDLVGKGLSTARTDGVGRSARMAFVKVRRALLPKAISGAAFSGELDRILARHGERRVAVLLPVMDWDVPLFQRPQHMALALAECGYLYFYCVPGSRDGVHGFREIADGVVLTDQLDLLRTLPGAKLWHLYSTDLVHDLTALRAHARGGDCVLYEYIDELDDSVARRGIPPFVLERHRALLEDERVCVVTSAEKLRDEVSAVRVHNHRLVTNGVDPAHFSVRRGEFPVPRPLAGIVAQGRPIVGYFGALASWFDYGLVHELALCRSDVEIVLIGDDYDGAAATVDRASLPNVHRLGAVPYPELPRWACWFDVGMIPFRINPVTESTSPLKLFEYMALGVPIVATDLRECRKYSSVLIGRDTDAFIACVDQALSLRDDAGLRATLAREAEENAWSRKGEQVAELLEASAARERTRGEGNS